MIFLSYTHKDEGPVDQIAKKLLIVFGRDKIFYDKWSIQPGDGIIDKMDEGLKNCKFFFFFVSKNSLQSSMVKLEWEPALMKKAKDGIKFIPVKLDDCLMPDILMQTLYVDVFGHGMEVGTRQIIDVIQNRNTYRTGMQTYENLRAYMKRTGKEVTIEFRAETYSEPISRFLILTDSKQDEISYSVTNESHFGSGFKSDLKLSTELKTNAVFISLDRGTTPAFPVIVSLKPKSDKEIKINGLMRAINQNEFRQIPVIEE